MTALHSNLIDSKLFNFQLKHQPHNLITQSSPMNYWKQALSDWNHLFREELLGVVKDQGVIIFFVLASEFFINYKISFHKTAKEAE